MEKLPPSNLLTNLFITKMCSELSGIPNQSIDLNTKIEYFIQALSIVQENQSLSPVALLSLLAESNCSQFLAAAVMEFMGHNVEFDERFLLVSDRQQKTDLL
jgi:hypothetical protein